MSLSIERVSTSSNAEIGPYPAYHLWTGNLPPIARHFHRSERTYVERDPRQAELELWTGNLPILHSSRELISSEGGDNGDDGLAPGWVQLRDPLTRASFWWNMLAGIRRSTRPVPGDDRTTRSAISSRAVATDVEESPMIVWPTYRGMLRKQGGGSSFFGQRSWKLRFFVVDGDSLSYYSDKRAYERGDTPLKGLYLPLRHYRVEPLLDQPTRLRLVSIADAARPRSSRWPLQPLSPGAAIVADIDARPFDLEAPTVEAKWRWLRVLRGRRRDGRHRADSAEWDELETAARIGRRSSS